MSSSDSDEWVSAGPTPSSSQETADFDFDDFMEVRLRARAKRHAMAGLGQHITCPVLPGARPTVPSGGPGEAHPPEVAAHRLRAAVAALPVVADTP
eukprot:812102-Alexandrium_andersonii.AAC.1